MFRWPTAQERTLIAGSTGSGKSVFAAHVLSNAPFDRQPYVIIDYKDEVLFNSITRAHIIDFKDKLPKYPGIYILKATPDLDDDRMNDWLWRVLKREKIGLVYDEGYMIPNKGAMNAIYTQGRSKRVPVITLTQRPAWLTRFAFSESSFFFYLNFTDDEDRKTFRRFVPNNDVWDLRRNLPKRYVRWFDVAENQSAILLPAPDPETILDKFDDRLRPRIKVF